MVNNLVDTRERVENDASDSFSILNRRAEQARCSQGGMLK